MRHGRLFYLSRLGILFAFVILPLTRAHETRLNRVAQRRQWEQFDDYLNKANAATERHDFAATEAWLRRADAEYRHITGKEIDR